jgi:hypothetical protein
LFRNELNPFPVELKVLLPGLEAENYSSRGVIIAMFLVFPRICKYTEPENS